MGKEREKERERQVVYVMFFFVFFFFIVTAQISIAFFSLKMFAAAAGLEMNINYLKAPIWIQSFLAATIFKGRLHHKQLRLMCNSRVVECLMARYINSDNVRLV